MKIILSLLLIILLIVFGSCNNDFNLNAPYKDIYVLNCILSNNTAIQYAVISKNFFTENGSLPASNSLNQNVHGADIKIFYNDSVFVMQDTTIQVKGVPVNCYYIKNLIIKPGKNIRVEALVPGGSKLESDIKLPDISFSDIGTDFPQTGFWGTLQMPYYSWSWKGDNDDITNVMCIPQLEIFYKKFENGAFADKKILVPLAAYFSMDEMGNLVPVAVKLSFYNNCVTELETVNRTMQEISGNDPYKKNYIINKVLFSVICLDSWLSRYCSAYDVYQENYTVKLRQTDVSNIKGGKGIFGAYYKFSRSLTVDSLYVNSFGYQYIPK